MLWRRWHFENDTSEITAFSNGDKTVPKLQYLDLSPENEAPVLVCRTTYKEIIYYTIHYVVQADATI